MKTAEEIRIITFKSIQAFSRLSDEAWSEKPEPLKWSKKEILGHLIDSALTNLRRFIMTQYAPNQKIVYHQDEWVALQRYQEANTEELVALWNLLNLQIERVIQGIPKVALKNTCDTGKENVEYYELEFLIADYLEHMKHHLRQILGHEEFIQSG